MEYVTIEGEYPAGPHGGVALVCALPVWLMLRALEAGRKSPTEVMRDVELLIRKVAEVLMECGVFKDAKATCDLATNPPSTLDAGSIGFVVRVLHRPGLSHFGGRFVASLTEDGRGLVIEHASYQTPRAPNSEEDRKGIMDLAQRYTARWVDTELAALCPEPCVCGRMPAVKKRGDGQITLSCCDLEVARPVVGRCAADRVTLEMIDSWNALVRTASREEVARLRSRVRELEELLGTAGAS